MYLIVYRKRLVPASTVTNILNARGISIYHNVSCHLEPSLILSLSIFFIILLLWPYSPSTAPSSITDLCRLHSHKPETPRSIISHNSFLQRPLPEIVIFLLVQVPDIRSTVVLPLKMLPNMLHPFVPSIRAFEDPSAKSTSAPSWWCSPLMPTPLSNIFERVLKVLLRFRAGLSRRRAPWRVHTPVVLGEKVLAVEVVV